MSKEQSYFAYSISVSSCNLLELLLLPFLCSALHWNSLAVWPLPLTFHLFHPSDWYNCIWFPALWLRFWSQFLFRCLLCVHLLFLPLTCLFLLIGLYTEYRVIRTEALITCLICQGKLFSFLLFVSFWYFRDKKIYNFKQVGMICSLFLWGEYFFNCRMKLCIVYSALKSRTANVCPSPDPGFCQKLSCQLSSASISLITDTYQLAQDSGHGLKLLEFKEFVDSAFRHRIWILGGHVLMILVGPFQLRISYDFIILSEGFFCLDREQMCIPKPWNCIFDHVFKYLFQSLEKMVSRLSRTYHTVQP